MVYVCQITASRPIGRRGSACEGSAQGRASSEKCNRAAACASSREAAGRLGACTAGPTHPSVTSAAALGLACPARQFTQFTVPSEPLNRKRAADAHASSHLQVQGGPFTAPPTAQNPASSLPPCQLKPRLGCLTLHIKSGTTNFCPVQLCNQHRRRIHMGGHPWGPTPPPKHY